MTDHALGDAARSWMTENLVSSFRGKITAERLTGEHEPTLSTAIEDFTHYFGAHPTSEALTVTDLHRPAQHLRPRRYRHRTRPASSGGCKTLDLHGAFLRDYRMGRRDYGLSASDAYEYAKDLSLLFDGDSPEWFAEPDDDGGLLVFLVPRGSGCHIDVLGGVDVPFEVSDHGNVLFDDQHPYFINTVADMIRGLDALEAA